MLHKASVLDYFYKRERDHEVAKFFDKEVIEEWRMFDSNVFGEGKLTRKEKELITVACTYMTRRPRCIEGHTWKAIKEGATNEEIDEAIAITAALSAGASFAHMNFALA